MAPSHRQPQSGQEAPPTNPASGPESPVGAAAPRLWRQVSDNLSRGRKPLPRIQFAPPRGSGNAATVAPSHRQPQSGQQAPPTNSASGPESPVGAATPRLWRQVSDNLSRGRKPLPRIQFAPPVGAATPRLWRHVIANLSRSSKPLPQIQFATPCGSGNAATPAPNQPHPQSGHEAPPTNAVGADTSDLLHGGDRDVRHLTPAADPPLFSCRLSFSSAH